MSKKLGKLQPDDGTRSQKPLARTLFDTGVRAIDPVRAARRELTGDPLPDLVGIRFLIVAFGKAATDMLTEALKHLPNGADHAAIAVTNYETHKPTAG